VSVDGCDAHEHEGATAMIEHGRVQHAGQNSEGADLEVDVPEHGAVQPRKAFRIARIENAWYFACTSESLKRSPLPLTVLDRPLVLYRDGNGRAAALLDRCAHRNVPLSGGRVAEGRLECPYHGWQFDSSGICRKVPALCGPHEAAARRVSSFAVREQHGLVWVWAQPDQTPDHEPWVPPHADSADFRNFHLDYRVEATLHATLENMLDVPHTAFLHRGLFRGGAQRRLRAIVRRSEDCVQVQYVGEPLPTGLAARILGLGENSEGAGNKDGTVEHHDRFILPSISQVDYGFGSSRLIATSLLTPESDFVTRFHTIISYRMPLPWFVMRFAFKPVAERILKQDSRILALQTSNVRRFDEESYVSTAVDLLGPEIWRMLERRAAGEETGPDLERELELLA
jgi:phenylpropionate dioxygenase-like ring-hydroxylating dioxygenase large terminal subunit